MSSDPFESKRPVQYLGESGITQSCLQAIDAVLSSGMLPKRATIVTHIYNRKSNPLQEEHLFIFWNWQYIPILIIPSGFASGYPGEGPKGFALAICMIWDKEIPIDIVFLNEEEFRILDEQRINDCDHHLFKKIKTNSEPLSLLYNEWVPEQYKELLEKGEIWRIVHWKQTKTDWFTESIGSISVFCPEAGKN